MTDLICAKVAAGASVAGKVLLPPALPLGLMAQSMITSDTGIPLSSVGAVGGACWYLNGRFTRIEDKLDAVQKNLEARPCQIGMCPEKKEITDEN